MKRILVVDDDSQVLGDLQRALEPLKDQWETSFARSGEEALASLKAAPCDVIISDVSMPGMDGATLLKQVCEKYPTIVRMALSSQREMQSALRTIPVAHQFLVKPCDTHLLRVGIGRATSLSEVLNNKLLTSIVGSVKDLPVMPRTYLALRQKLVEPDVSVKDVVKLVEQDVGISAKILQLVNSAFFGLPREISTLLTAVSYLGIDMVQNMVLSAEVFRVFERTAALPGFSFEEMHQHSQLTAKIAARIPAQGTAHDVAVVAGLLHDVGKLVLATRSPKHFARALAGAKEEKRPLYAVEEELMGVSHAEVGAYLLGIWGLPCPVVEAVAHHHQPRRAPHEVLDAVGAVHIANCLAHSHSLVLAAGDAPVNQAMDAEYLEAIGMSDQVAEWEQLAEEAANSLRSGAVERSESRVSG